MMMVFDCEIPSWSFRNQALHKEITNSTTLNICHNKIKHPKSETIIDNSYDNLHFWPTNLHTTCMQDFFVVYFNSVLLVSFYLGVEHFFHQCWYWIRHTENLPCDCPQWCRCLCSAGAKPLNLWRYRQSLEASEQKESGQEKGRQMHNLRA